MPRFPLPSDKPCKYPYMYIDPQLSMNRRRYFFTNKYEKLIDSDYDVHACYTFTMEAFYNLMDIFVNQQNLSDFDRVCIYFALYDNSPNVPFGCENSFTFIFATEIDSAENYPIKYFIIDKNDNKVKEQSEDDVKQWRGLYEYNILPKLQDTLDPESVQMGVSPTDTRSISYDVLGLSQIYREMEYQQNSNKLTIAGIKIYFSSYRTKDLDPSSMDYPYSYPQRLITQLEILEKLNGETIELDIQTTPDFKFRIKEARPVFQFDTGNLCPPKCQN